MVLPGFESSPWSGCTQGQEQILPDGIAIAHGRIIVITTAGHLLAFK